MEYKLSHIPTDLSLFYGWSVLGLCLTLFSEGLGVQIQLDPSLPVCAVSVLSYVSGHKVEQFG